ncbi:MAG: site-specific integrase [Nocardioidaceae bacterium]|nr:site-specific integrase [Nocardioidaceae bacterium]NUS52480.1 site-specific integrase [Nocardioidaceae bacterium]
MIERRVLPSGRVTWRVRYYGPDLRERSKSFRLRRDAEAYDAKTRTERHRGDWVDPRRGRATLADVWADYERVGMGHLRETTKSSYRNSWRHVAETFGQWPVAKIEHADVADWVTSLSARSGPDLVRYAHRVLCLVLDHAMKSRRVPINVARGVRLPRRPPGRDRFLTAPQVQLLADKLGRDGDLVLAMAYLGLRWSELAALKVADVDLARRRVHVVERATEVGGRIDVSAPKSHASNRHIAIPGLLVDLLQARTEGRPLDALVFPAPGGGYLRNRNWRVRSGFNEASKALGIEITPHDLRRTFGSLARAAGADLRWVQKAMGHESITTTARIYAHLYDDELDSVAAALDRIGRGH